jgi:hypothetical protein
MAVLIYFHIKFIANHLERFAASSLPRDIETVDDDDDDNDDTSKGPRRRNSADSHDSRPKALTMSEKSALINDLLEVIKTFSDILRDASMVGNPPWPDFPI